MQQTAFQAVFVVVVVVEMKRTKEGGAGERVLSRCASSNSHLLKQKAETAPFFLKTFR